MNTLKAFVVEDSALVLRELASMLAETCDIHVVASADSESDALKIVRDAAKTYDLITIDVFLREGSGLRVLRDARVLHPNAHLVVLTNYATLDVRKRCLSLGADRVFDKSKQLEDLIGYCTALSGVGDLQHMGADEGPCRRPPAPSRRALAAGRVSSACRWLRRGHHRPPAFDAGGRSAKRPSARARR
jgi:two-component system, OmpR family, response regulator